MLEVYPNAPLRDVMARRAGRSRPTTMWPRCTCESMERLERAGYEQYEISNVAKPGRRSRHNLKYWRDGEWLGVGPGAHSTRHGVRWKNVASTPEYIAAVAAGTQRELERRELTAETRVRGGAVHRAAPGRWRDACTTCNARYGVDVWARYGEALQPFVDEGWLIYDGGTLRLTRAGMLVAHEVMAVFVALNGQETVRYGRMGRPFRGGVKMRRLFGVVLAGAILMLPAFSQHASAAGPGRSRRWKATWRCWNVAIRPDKTADYEQVLGKLKEALDQVHARPKPSSSWPAGR